MAEEAISTRFESDDEEGRCTPSPEPETKKRKLSPAKLLPADVMKGNEADYGDFVLDRTESISLDDEDMATLENSSGDSSVWKEKILASLLTGTEDESADQSGKKNTQKKNNGCFNCDGDHHLNECPEPKDMKKIRQRQTEMRNRSNVTRYHDGTPTEKKFRAGRISDGLRNALGIGKHDIPEYIYRMRRMGFIRGYPPGYLKKSVFSYYIYLLTFVLT
ncbi:PSP domain-containing protein [Trichostrongylus colubriformis]|uniref:PSP domain-containing protein n=1 Tax=Trichostrongylus colubriformis TaxID=6319 RepID=A0AAN8IJS6_TRICO